MSDRQCDCVSKIYFEKPFQHYNRKKDHIGTEWDDFGYHEYLDEKGNVITKTYFHSHLGVVHSYIHGFSFDKIPKKYHEMKTVTDNSVISAIREKIVEIINNDKK